MFVIKAYTVNVVFISLELVMLGCKTETKTNKSDISCLKNQPDAFPVQYTQLSQEQATKLQL